MEQSGKNGHAVQEYRPTYQENLSQLQRTPEDEINDVICIGFGPASLAIAIALQDALESSKRSEILPNLYGRSPKVTFLERQEHFAWHAGMLLEGAKMQISFIKDLATLRDPRSHFTFLNYLHQHNRLLDFTNLATFLPQRIEYEDYMRWCASHFENVVEYSQEVLDVVPEKKAGNSKVETFIVRSKNLKTQNITTRRARNVIVSTGGKPSIPESLPYSHPRVIHSSQYAHLAPQILNDPSKPYKVAVVGGGQSAAEIFSNIQNLYPNSKTYLLIHGGALKPSDDSPFVNEIFNPSRVDDYYHRDPVTREQSITHDKNTNYGVVRLELIEHIYEKMYTQRLRLGHDESRWPHRILPYRSVVSIDDSPIAEDQVRVHVYNNSGDYLAHETSGYEELDVDLVMLATGYERNAHESILKGARHLMKGGDHGDNKWMVERNYRVMFDDGKVASNSGVWLQGCCEKTHGLSDTLLSIVATRSGEIVKSLFGSERIRPSNGHAS
ncbi:hydroxylase [Patellaria atrata CBS 101060]|uniref:L-ornithine N(5)-monooxygenase [NAD(P)H] n=1 Tax=Patellaria atrata CBS 101060 TaxID=1346257 RepID=A0A9P4VRN3_9PEZI|nr:hydroxylase [Patellaria atrata CBS 101060]